MLNGLGIYDLVEVVAPSDVSTDDTLTVDLVDDLGLTSDQVSALKEAFIVSKRTSSDVGQVEDDKVEIDGENLVITEGSTGFSGSDVFVVALVIGMPTVTATSTTA